MKDLKYYIVPNVCTLKEDTQVSTSESSTLWGWVWGASGPKAGGIALGPEVFYHMCSGANLEEQYLHSGRNGDLREVFTHGILFAV